MARVFGTAMSGNCSQRPELVEQALPLSVKIAALPSRGGPAILGRLFEPLGYTVKVKRHPLDETFAEWGESPYYEVQLDGEVRLRICYRTCTC